MVDSSAHDEYCNMEKHSASFVNKNDDNLALARKRRRVDVEEAQKLSAIERLPHEILVMILRHFDSLKLAGFHVISKRFHDVLSTTPTLWRDGMFLDGDAWNDLMVPAWLRIQELLRRGDGKIERLGLILDAQRLSHAEFDFMKLVDVLPKMGLREAHVRSDHYVPSLDEADISSCSQEGFESLQFHLFNALSRCANLESLWLQCTARISADTLIPRMQNHWRVLRHLKLTGFSSWGALLSMQVSLTFDHLYSLYIDCGYVAQEKDFCELLRGCSQTLCELWVSINFTPNEMIHPAATSAEIHMPKLRLLSWDAQHSKVKLHTPQVRHLLLPRHSIEVGITLPKALETLAVYYGEPVEQFPGNQRREDLQSLRECECLHSLSIISSRGQGTHAAFHLSLATNTSLRQLDISESRTNLDAFVGLVKSMRHRMQVDSACKVPLRLRIKTDRVVQERARNSINWLADNITFLDIKVRSNQNLWLITRLEQFQPIEFDGALEGHGQKRFW